MDLSKLSREDLEKLKKRKLEQQANAIVDNITAPISSPRPIDDQQVAQDIVLEKAQPIALQAAERKRQVSKDIVRQRPDDVKEVVDNLPIDQATKNDVKRDISNQAQGRKREPLSAQFTDALTYFLPSIIGGLGGGLVGGEDAALMGMQEGQKMGDAFRNFNLKERELFQKQSKQAIDVDSFVDDQGNPVKANLATGEFTDLSGNLVDASRIKRTNIFKQDRSLDQRQSEQKDINTRFAKRFNLDKQKLSQLSDKQTESFAAFNDTLDSLDAIEALKPEVNTGPIADRIQAMQELMGAAPKAYTDLKVSVRAMGNNYIKAITGAQMSEQEADRILAVVPMPNDDDRTFSVKLKAFREVVNRNKKALERAIRTGQPLKKLDGIEEAIAEVEKESPKKQNQVSISKQLDIIKRIKARKRGNK